MRRMILGSLILFPVLAQAQSNIRPGAATANSRDGQAAATASTLLARIDAPVAPTASGPAAHLAVREVITQTSSSDFTENALNDGGTLSYTLRSTPVEASAPKLIQATELELTVAELAAQPAKSSVAVRMTVDEQGLPHNLAIAKSAGSAIDLKALAAASQYRFRPATWNDRAVATAVTVSVAISKQ